MFIDFLLDVFREKADWDAVVWNGRVHSYAWLLEKTEAIHARLLREGVTAGAITAIEGECSPSTIALFLALLDRACVLVPLTRAVDVQKAEFAEIAQVEWVFRFEGDELTEVKSQDRRARHDLYDTLRERGHPGLVLFSSGSTGKSKAIVHDAAHLLQKYKTRRQDLRTLAFLLIDHIGGVDTVLYTLSNGSCLVTIDDRSPAAVCRAIEQYRVEVLPVSPTFLNLLLLSGEHARHDLSSLKYITYGAEVMPESTLKRCVEVFPGVNFLQKYGTTEVGTLRSKSRTPDSVWVKVGGEGYETRVVDSMLQIKAHSAMLGYLNAPSPFTADGWFITGDMVEQDGEYLRILGRKSEIINVGGEKVYPAEVEGVIQSMPGVAHVRVFGERNPITGQIVCAEIVPAKPGDVKILGQEVKAECRKRLEPYKVPVKVKIVDQAFHGDRFKKFRPIDA